MNPLKALILFFCCGPLGASGLVQFVGTFEATTFRGGLLSSQWQVSPLQEVWNRGGAPYGKWGLRGSAELFQRNDLSVVAQLSGQDGQGKRSIKWSQFQREGDVYFFTTFWPPQEDGLLSLEDGRPVGQITLTFFVGKTPRAQHTMRILSGD